jgi:hypothetical protein
LILVHLIQDDVDFFLVDVVAKPSQQEFQCPTGNITSIISIVHLENFPKLFNLFSFVGIEELIGVDYNLGGIKGASPIDDGASFFHWQ